MTDKPTPTDAELKSMLELHAVDIGGIFYYARAVLAKWGQPAQAEEPVAVVVPCYTPSGKRVALCSAKQDLPIGTKLYAAPQPSPTPHGQVPVVHGDALSDAVRVPLDSLHADAAYLIGRLRDGSMPYVRVIEIIRERIDAASPKAQAAESVSAVGGALEVSDAMADSQYLAGVSAGWNAANAGDPNAALQKLHASRAGYLKPLATARKQGVSHDR